MRHGRVGGSRSSRWWSALIVILAAAHIHPQPPAPPAEVPKPKPEQAPRVQPQAAHPGNTFRHIDDPDGELSIGALDGDTALGFIGKVRVLRIKSLNGSARLDASGLEAREIIVTGAIDGSASLRLSAPGGKVDFQGVIAGGTRVEINAPDGSVSFGKDGAASLIGGTILSVTARDIAIQGRAGGGVRMSVTFTKDGSLKFRRLDEGATISFRKSAPGDAAPRIDRGDIAGGASVREGDGAIPLLVAMPERRSFRRQQRELAPPPPPDLYQPKPTDGPTLAAGIIPRDAPALAARIVRVDENEVIYLSEKGEQKAMPIASVAVVLFRAFPESKWADLNREAPGILLSNGDYFEGSPTNLERRQITLTSVLFGLKTFNLDREAVALILANPGTLSKK